MASSITLDRQSEVESPPLCSFRYFTDNRKHRGISKLKKHETEFGQSAIDVRCLAEATGGQYIQTNNQEELVEAFQKTLGCPMMSRLAPSVALRFGPTQTRRVGRLPR